jgi:(2Fe-2S) ferredoxin
MPKPVRLVVCVNQRLGIGQRSCGGSGNLVHIEKIRELIDAAGLDVTVVEQVCFGKCEQGPVMRIAPGGRFFTGVDESVLSHIIDELESFIQHRRD